MLVINKCTFDFDWNGCKAMILFELQICDYSEHFNRNVFARVNAE